MSTGHANLATSLVVTPPSPSTSGTSLVVTTGEGSRFPTVPFWATIWPPAEFPTSANSEVVRVTARSSDTLTIVRAQGGTTAKAVTAGYRIANALVAADMSNVMDVRRYGALGNLSNDDTAEIQAAIDAAIAANAEVVIPPGNYIISDTLTIASANGFKMTGAGYQTSFSGGLGTRLLWSGANDRPVILLQDVGNGYFGDFSIRPLSASFPFLTGIETQNIAAAATQTPRYTTFERVAVYQAVAGDLILKAGFYHSDPDASTVDGNNDFHIYRNCKVLGYANCGFLSMHSQSKGTLLDHCEFSGATTNTLGKIAVSMGNDTHASLTANGGSIRIYGGSMSWNTVADVYVGTPNDTIVIEGVNSEKSSRLLDTGGPSSAGRPITIRDNRWGAVNSLTPLQSDSGWLRLRGTGPYLVYGNVVEAYPSEVSTEGLPIVIVAGAGTGTTKMALTVHDNEILTTATNVLATGTDLTNIRRSFWNNKYENRTGSDTWGYLPSYDDDRYMVIEKPSDETIVNNTLQSDDSLVLNLHANAKYDFKVMAFVTTASSTCGGKYAVGGTVGVTNMRALIQTFTGGFLDFTIALVTAKDETLAQGTTAGSGTVEIEGSIETSTAGTFIFMWAQSVTDAANGLIVKRNSFIKATRTG